MDEASTLGTAQASMSTAQALMHEPRSKPDIAEKKENQ
jgi:hypothetical protein